MGFDKRQLYEFDIRVPLIARGPGIPKKTEVDGVAVSIDLVPTFLDMMGIEKPEQMDGKSWLPLAQGNSDKSWRHDFLVEYNGPHPIEVMTGKELDIDE